MLLSGLREYSAWASALWANRRATRMTRPQLEALQQRKFRRLVRHAYVKSPYWRRLMDTRRLSPETCRLEDFPVMAKADTQRHFAELQTDPRVTLAGAKAFSNTPPDPSKLYLDRYQVVHSSGTSGSQAYFVFSIEDWIAGASTLTRAPGKVRFRKRIAAIIDCKARYAGVLLSLLGSRGLNRLFYNTLPIDVTTPDEQMIEQLNRFQPYFLTGYASSIKRLAEAQERGLLRIRPRELSRGGEMLSDQDHAYIERVFDAPMYNNYGCTEGLFLALSLGDEKVLTLQEDQNIIEVRDDHLLITPLFNHTMPMIRFRINDALVLGERLSAHGPFRQVAKLAGRSDLNLFFDSGTDTPRMLHWAVTEGMFVPGVFAFQLEQVDQRRLIYRVQYAHDLSGDRIAETNRQISRMLHDVLESCRLDLVSFEIEPVPVLRPNPRTGKLARIIPAKLPVVLSTNRAA